MRWKNGCFAHIVSTATGRSFEPIDSTLSNLCRFALSQRPGGAFDKLRNDLVDVIVSRAVLVQGARPTCGANIAHRDLVLDFLIEDTKAGRIRRAALKLMLHGNLRRRMIPIYYVGHAPDIHVWAKDLGKLLLPTKVPLMQRQRWLTSLLPISMASLLFEVYNLAEETLPRWVLSLHNRKKPVLMSKFDADDVEEYFQHIDEEFSWRAPPSAAKSDFDWNKYNLAQQAGSVKLAVSISSQGDLLCSKIVLGPLHYLLRTVLHVDSDAWMYQQMAKSAEGQPMQGRGHFCRSGKITEQYFEDVDKLLANAEGEFTILGTEFATMHFSTKVFAMLARHSAVIFQLIHKVLASPPWLLFDIVHGDDTTLQGILNTCVHSQDSRRTIQYNVTSLECRQIPPGERQTTDMCATV